jgi:hypothetical protein
VSEALLVSDGCCARAAWARIAAAAVLLLALGAAAPEPVVLVACAPGYPGTTAEAQPSMDALAAALARAAHLPAGDVSGVYLPAEADGVARLERGGAVVALVPAPFFAKHAAALKLRARLAVVPTGLGGPTEVWTLWARKGKATSPADLAGYRLLSTAGYAPEFVRALLAGRTPLPPTARIEASGQVLSALRQAASGGDVAVLLDGVQGAALPGLPFAADLDVLARSAPLPAAVVATVGTAIPAPRWSALEKALVELAGAPDGAAALQGVRMEAFVPFPAGAAGALAAVTAKAGR